MCRVKRILIVGATSSIATQYARLEAEHGSHLCLLGRSRESLNALAADLSIRGASRVDAIVADINSHHLHRSILDQVIGDSPLDVVLIAHGILPDNELCMQSPEHAIGAFTTNATSTIAFMIAAADRLQDAGRGTLAVISSVAGDRGRASNAVYGSAKAAVSAFASGLRQRLHETGVNVLTIKPGLVDTPMTTGYRKGILWSSPQAVALIIARAIDRKRSVVYAPKFWGIVMSIISHIPEFLFRRIRL